MKKSVPPVPGKYREWTEPIWGMIQVGLEHVQGTVLSRFKDCSRPDQGLFRTRARTVMDQNQECSEHDWGIFWAWMGTEWSRFGDDLSQDWNRTRTCSGPVWDRQGLPRCQTIYHQSGVQNFPAIYGHLSAKNISKYNHVIKSASKLSTNNLLMYATYQTSISSASKKCLCITCTENDFDKQPSGRLRAVEYQVNVWKYCFRAQCVKFYNELLR